MAKYPTIKTPRWAAALQLIADTLPYYAGKDGQPNPYHILRALAAEGVTVIDGSNVDEMAVILAERRRRAEAKAAIAAEQAALFETVSDHYN